MKIKLNQIISDNTEFGPIAYYSLSGGLEKSQIYLFREVEIEVPDLPDDEFIKSFANAKRIEGREARIDALKAELERLEAGE